MKKGNRWYGWLFIAYLQCMMAMLTLLLLTDEGASSGSRMSDVAYSLAFSQFVGLLILHRLVRQVLGSVRDTPPERPAPGSLSPTTTSPRS